MVVSHERAWDAPQLNERIWNGPQLIGRTHSAWLRSIAFVAMIALLGCRGGSPDTVMDGMATSADGVPIHYHAEGHGSPALVFIHAWSCNGDYWAPQLAYFAPSHRVVTLDLAGHGRSAVDRKEWTIEAYGEDVRAIVTALALPQVILIGHSMGGAVMVEAALDMPERVIGLICVDTFQQPRLNISDSDINNLLAPFRKDYVNTTRAWARGMFAPGADSTIVERISALAAAAPPQPAIASLQSLMLWHRDRAPEALAQLSVPLQCINSDRYPTDVTGLTEAVPDYMLRLMPGRGHFLMLEDPAGFNLLLEQAVTDLSAEHRSGS